MKKIVVGLFAHVDAGKTTLSESILYNTGTIKQIGRVDNKNTFLDFDKVERERGITVFSKQAILKTENSVITILDTPGHIDFSTEAERTVQVLDYAVLIISARDGIQAHTETLWKILKKYGIPTIFFVNKMDLEDVEEDNLFEGISSKLSEHSVDFSKPLEDNLENIAMCSEDSLEEYLQTGTLNQSTISKLISERKLFPIYFGSALKNIGVRELIEGMDTYMMQKEFLSDFSAKVFKITHDKQGNRLTHMKITGGSLKVKSLISYNPIDSEELIQEKVNMIRLYSGDKFETCEEAESGFICAVTGLNYTFSGQGLGSEQKNYSPVLEPVMSYNVILPDGMDSVSFLPKIKIMEEEDPQLKVGYDEITKSISVHLMGDIQSEILKRQISERFGIDINFGDGKILYKETIINPVEGIGHYEPLRHYAEVHLLIEPIATGSGIVVSSNCSEDVLDRNWQHLILSHICEKTHKGVLIGAPLTDVRISLIVGRAHIKHTEGGDFRQATYRAIRQGLMKAESIILEPYYLVKINLPSQTIGHAITDIKNMGGMILSTNLEGNNAVIEARAPVSEIQHYFINLMTYTKGQGNISYVSDGYRPCHNQEKIIKEIGYDPETDLNNTPDSVFCSHGAGVNIKWYDIEKYMHLSSGINFDDNTGIPLFSDIKVFKRNFDIDEKELEEIMDREFGPIRRKQYSSSAVIDVKVSPNKEKERKSYCYIVDGYNLIGSWDAYLAYETNPAMGYRIAERTVASEFESMEKSGFARERLGWWSPVAVQQIEYALDKGAWKACESKLGKPEGKTAYGVKFSPDGSTVSLCGAVIDENGKARISLIEHQPTTRGIRWLSDWLNERYNKACCVVVDGRNGVDVLVDRISDVWRVKDSIIKPSTKDVIASVSLLTDEVNEKTLTWYYGQEVLNDSAVNAIKRPLGGGYGFGGDNSTPIEAAALALFGVRTSKRDPQRKMRIG